jgi:transposase
MDKRFLEDCLAKGMSLPEIGKLAGKPGGTVGYWVKKYELRANGSGRFGPRGGIDWEVLEILVEDGLTLTEMAGELDRSISTVRYWLREYGLEPTGGSRRQEARQAREAGLQEVELECKHHGRTSHVLQNSGTYRCVKCRSRNVANRRRKVKEILVTEAGGKCQICGYDRCVAALEFHHRDPEAKEFGLARRGITRAIEKVRAEAAKCVLLCATCHAELEAGFVELPIK